MNSQVSATGMSVTASTSGTLLIAKDNASWTEAGTKIDYATDFASGAVDVAPTSMNPSAAASTWYVANGTDANNGAKVSTEGYTALSSFTTTGAKYQSGSDTYALVETFYIKSPTGDLENLGLKTVKVTKNNSQTTNLDIDKAICVRIEIKTFGGDDTVYTTWANSGSTTITYVKGTAATGSTATGYVLSGTDTLVKNSSDTVNHVMATVSQSASYEVKVYIYVDGENANCTATKAYDWSGVSVDLTFAADVTYSNESATTPSVTISQASGVVTATPANVPSGKTAQYILEMYDESTSNWVDATTYATQSGGTSLEKSGNVFTLTDSGYNDKKVRVKMGVTEDNSNYNYISNEVTISGISE